MCPPDGAVHYGGVGVVNEGGTPPPEAGWKWALVEAATLPGAGVWAPEQSALPTLG
jgi:hypothetical protein